MSCDEPVGDVHGDFELCIARVKVCWLVIAIEHDDDDAEEPAEDGHGGHGGNE